MKLLGVLGILYTNIFMSNPVLFFLICNENRCNNFGQTLPLS